MVCQVHVLLLELCEHSSFHGFICLAVSDRLVDPMICFWTHVVGSLQVTLEVHQFLKFLAAVRPLTRQPLLKNC